MIGFKARASHHHVVIAGGGVAALETLLGLRALAGQRVAITLLAPDAKFVNRSMAVNQPARIGSAGGLRLQQVADEFGAVWDRGRIARLHPHRHVVVTDHGHELHYDHLVLAVGARAQRPWRTEGVLTYRDARDASDYRRLLHQLRAGRVAHVAFVEPRGSSWPLPLYELVLTAAADAETSGHGGRLSVLTPAPSPLAIFGSRASEMLSAALADAGVRLHVASTGVPSRPGRLFLLPEGRRLDVDRIVTVPRLAGPGLLGVPSDDAGFIPVDRYGRVLGLPDVFAAGDATTFPVKQGGIAAQQADAVAETIAAAAGADVSPRPFKPVLRSLLRVGGALSYIRRPLVDGAQPALVSRQPLWWPPNRLCGRYLAPYLSRCGTGGAMYREPGVPSRPTSPTTALAELADLHPA